MRRNPSGAKRLRMRRAHRSGVTSETHVGVELGLGLSGVYFRKESADVFFKDIGVFF